MRFQNVLFHSDNKQSETNRRLGVDVKAVRIRSVSYKTPASTTAMATSFLIHEFDALFSVDDEPYGTEENVEANGVSLSSFFDENGSLEELPERTRAFSVAGGQTSPQEWLDAFSAALRTNLDAMTWGNKVVFTNSYNPADRTYNWHITYNGTPRKNFYVTHEGSLNEFNAFNRLIGWPTQTLDDECVLVLTYHSVQDMMYSYRSYMNIPIDYVLLRSNALASWGSIVDGSRKNVLKSIPLLGAGGETWVTDTGNGDKYWTERPTSTQMNAIDWYITDLYGNVLSDAVFAVDYDIK